MTFTLVALGSNLGDRTRHLEHALRAMHALPGTRVLNTTAATNTVAIGPPQPDYLNQMALLDTTFGAHELLDRLLDIEVDAGRVRDERWGPRTLDLDIVWMDAVQCGTDAITVPHAEWANRSFWLDQAAELLPKTWTADGGLPEWAGVSQARRDHITRVAGLMSAWAGATGVGEAERVRWLRAAWLHDAMKDAAVDEQRRWADRPDWPDPILHGPAAANRAVADGETDEAVLDAVRFHTVGHVNWDRTGKLLYVADYLEPGRRHRPENRDQLVTLAANDTDAAFRAVARLRRRYVLDRGFVVPEETKTLWTTLRIDED